MLATNHNYPIKTVCAVWGVARSSYYYQNAEPDEAELRLRAAVEQVAAEWPTYGCRRLTHQLRRQGYCVNTKHVWRLMRELGLQAAQPAAQPKKKCSTTNSQHTFPRFPNLVLTREPNGGWTHLKVERPEQLWVGDITYHVCAAGARLCLPGCAHGRLHPLDQRVAVRPVAGWRLDAHRAKTSNAGRQARNSSLRPGGLGGYAVTGYVELLQEAGVAISMAEVGEAWQNGYAERLMRTIKEEEVALTEYHDFHDAYSQIGRFLEEVYQHKRIHSALGYLTPAEFEQSWGAAQSGELRMLLP